MIRWALAATLLTLATPALADIAPPPDSPDYACTPAEQCPHGTTCAYSRSPGKQQANAAQEACVKAALDKGLEYRCRHGNNYVGESLYCPKGEKGTWTPPTGVPSAPAVPAPSVTPSAAPAPSASGPAGDAASPAPPKPASRCAVTAGEATADPMIALAALALGALAGRRSRRLRPGR